jgi:hypothetical protein
MKAQTISSEKTWESSDGTRSIWEVSLKGDDGKTYRLKTYSERISQVGYSGEVKSYVNPRGERFVRQVPSPDRPAFNKAGASDTGRDDRTIKAQWAIGQAVSVVQKSDPTLDDDFYTRVEMTAAKFFNMVDKIKEGN